MNDGMGNSVVTHHMANGVEIGGAVVGRRGRVGGEVRVEGEAIGDLVERHLRKERMCRHAFQEYEYNTGWSIWSRNTVC